MKQGIDLYDFKKLTDFEDVLEKMQDNMKHLHKFYWEYLSNTNRDLKKDILLPCITIAKNLEQPLIEVCNTYLSYLITRTQKLMYDIELNIEPIANNELADINVLLNLELNINEWISLIETNAKLLYEKFRTFIKLKDITDWVEDNNFNRINLFEDIYSAISIVVNDVSYTLSMLHNGLKEIQEHIKENNPNLRDEIEQFRNSYLPLYNNIDKYKVNVEYTINSLVDSINSLKTNYFGDDIELEIFNSNKDMSMYIYDAFYKLPGGKTEDYIYYLMKRIGFSYRGKKYYDNDDYYPVLEQGLVYTLMACAMISDILRAGVKICKKTDNIRKFIVNAGGTLPELLEEMGTSYKNDNDVKLNEVLSNLKL